MHRPSEGFRGSSRSRVWAWLVLRSSDDGGSHIALRGDLDMLHGTFVLSDLATFTCLDELGLEVVA